MLLEQWMDVKKIKCSTVMEKPCQRLQEICKWLFAQFSALSG
jgi:hypothetical protein